MAFVHNCWRGRIWYFFVVARTDAAFMIRLHTIPPPNCGVHRCADVEVAMRRPDRNVLPFLTAFFILEATMELGESMTLSGG
jgi:hypothetical protein